MGIARVISYMFIQTWLFHAAMNWESKNAHHQLWLENRKLCWCGHSIYQPLVIADVPIENIVSGSSLCFSVILWSSFLFLLTPGFRLVLQNYIFH